MPTSRRERAAETTRRMATAACRVFGERGYAGTTMAAVADEAGVAVQTLYFRFHTKAELLQAAYEQAVLGPEGVPPHLAPWWKNVLAAADVRAAVAYLVGGTVPILERAAPLVRIVQADPEVRAVYEHNERLRREGNIQLVAALTEKHPLREGVEPARALDLLLALTGPQVFQLLTADYGWSVADYADWTTGAILRELFAAE